jgi:hypothetical protein
MYSRLPRPRVPVLVTNRTVRAPAKRVILLRAIFRLNGPIFAVLIAPDQINTFVKVGQIDRLANVGRHLAQQPNLAQRGAIFGLVLQIELNRPFKIMTLFVFGKLSHPLVEIFPRMSRKR